MAEGKNKKKSRKKDRAQAVRTTEKHRARRIKTNATRQDRHWVHLVQWGKRNGVTNAMGMTSKEIRAAVRERRPTVRST